MMLKIAFIDLDGVMNSISDVRKSLEPVYTDRASYWSEWHKAHTREILNPFMVAEIQHLRHLGFIIAFLSNRTETCGVSTIEQLEPVLVPRVHDGLIMRSPFDDTPPAQFKVSKISDFLTTVRIVNPGESLEVRFYEDDNQTQQAVRSLFSSGMWCPEKGVNSVIFCLQTFRG